MKTSLVLMLLLVSTTSQAIEFAHSYKEKMTKVNRFLDFNDPFYLSSNLFYKGGIVRHWQYPTQFIDDPNLGRRNRPSAEVRHIQRTDKTLIFDSIYSFDEYGRRYAEIKNPEQRKKFLILYGCSYTYGEGLNDNQTLNYFLSKKLPDFYPYNYGIGGSGTNSMLALIQENGFHQQISQKEGFFIYVYIDSHIDRAAGLLPSLRWNKDTPNFDLDGANHLVRNGTLASAHPIRLTFYNFIDQILVFLGRRKIIFPNIGTKETEYTCQLIEESKNEFLKQYPTSQFFTYIHPHSGMNAGVELCLKRKNIPILYSKPLPSDTFILGDGHPNEKANDLITDELTELIRKL